jgi:chromosome segregation ATPase
LLSESESEEDIRVQLQQLQLSYAQLLQEFQTLHESKLAQESELCSIREEQSFIPQNLEYDEETNLADLSVYEVIEDFNGSRVLDVSEYEYAVDETSFLCEVAPTREEQLTTQLELAHQQIRDFEQLTVPQLTQENSGLQCSLAKSTRDLSRLEEELHRANVKLEAKNLQIHLLQDTVANTQAQLQNGLALCEQNTADSQTSQSQLREELSELTERLLEKDTSLLMYQEKTSLLETNILHLELANQQLSDRLRDTIQQLEHTSSVSEAFQTQVSSLQEQLLSAQTRHTELECELVTAQETQEQLLANLELLSHQAEGLATDITQSSEKLVQSDIEREKLSTQVVKLQQHNQSLSEQLLQAEQNHLQVQTNFEAAQLELLRLQRAYDDHTSEIILVLIHSFIPIHHRYRFPNNACWV